MFLRKLFFSMLLSVSFLQSKNYYLIDSKNDDNGLIKIWFTTLGLLDEYDKGEILGFEILFDENGKHFDSKYGFNWWQYYFDFNSIGSKEQSSVLRIPCYKRSMIRFNTICTMQAERANYLINKYVKFNQNIKSKFDTIKQKFWTDKDCKIVGIYYQKPMMPEIQTFLDPISLCNKIKKEIERLDNFKICLFTDLDNYSKIFAEQFQNNFFSIELLKDKKSPYQSGENELLTLLLLSQCNIVIAPGSYQGTGAKMLNPQLKLIELDMFPYARE